jgi:hypothetical protein
MVPAHNFGEAAVLALLRQPGEALPLYQIWMDGPVVRINAGGIWDAEAADAYSSDIARVVEEARRTRPLLRAIVDRSAGPTFLEGVPERLLATYKQILRAGDRIAMIVDSSLIKGHIRRVADREETQSFLSLSAARTWLLAYG